MSVLIETTLGDMVVDLFVKERPRCSLNFVKLCKKKYYNFCQFHSIEQNYIAQTGDPTGKGNGGESIFTEVYGYQARYFEPEVVPKMRHTRAGLVSFVNNGSGMLGSQFFFTLADNLDFLDDKHTIFGQVTEGKETLEKLNSQICDEHSRPYRDIRISHTIVLDDPFDDFEGLEYPRSPSPSMDLLVPISQIALDQSWDEDEGKTEEEIREEMEATDMAAQAQILEMVGDLRHADDKPPENVLFVCKLNPVTTDEDLEVIFSRFGKIVCCEIIRDRRTQASLLYAFIEFEDPKSCEDAYFKMDNVLIDDRRIHVDFSQSVSKSFQWERKIKAVEGEKGEPEKKKRRGDKVNIGPNGRETEKGYRGEKGKREEQTGRDLTDHGKHSTVHDKKSTSTDVRKRGEKRVIKPDTTEVKSPEHVEALHDLKRLTRLRTDENEDEERNEKHTAHRSGSPITPKRPRVSSRDRDRAHHHHSHHSHH